MISPLTARRRATLGDTLVLGILASLAAAVLAAPLAARADRIDGPLGGDLLASLALDAKDLPAGVTRMAAASGAARVERQAWKPDDAGLMLLGTESCVRAQGAAGAAALLSLLEVRMRVFVTSAAAEDWLEDDSRGTTGWTYIVKGAKPVEEQAFAMARVGDDCRFFAGGAVGVVRAGRAVLAVEARPVTPAATVAPAIQADVKRLMTLLAKKGMALPSKAPAGALTVEDVPRELLFLGAGALPIDPALDPAPLSATVALWSEERPLEPGDLAAISERVLRFASPEAAASALANRAAPLHVTEVVPTPWKAGEDCRVLEGGRLALVRLGSLVIEVAFDHDRRADTAPLDSEHRKHLAPIVAAAAKRAAVLEGAKKSGR